MTTIRTTGTPTHPLPRRGGFTRAFFAAELRRALRNKRGVAFVLIMPVALFLIFSGNGQMQDRIGNGNYMAWYMIGIAFYGAMLANTAGGAMVSIERALGWSRQLRLTPLRPIAYIGIKVAVAAVQGLFAVAIVYALGIGVRHAEISVAAAVAAFIITVVLSALFAAVGLFFGYLLPTDDVMKVLGPGLALLGFASGMFFQLSGFMVTVAKFVPSWGVVELARAPMGMASAADLGIAALNVAVWAAIFVGGSALLFARDGKRV